MELQQQQAGAPDSISKTKSGEGEALQRVETLENQLRGMILKNQSPRISEATAGTSVADSSLSPPKAAEVTPFATKKYGRSEPREIDAHRGRGRRPNQAQRRQIGNIDLKGLPTTTQSNAHQSGGNFASPKNHQPEPSQIQKAANTQAQAQLAQSSRASPNQQPFINPRRNVSNRPGILPPNQQPYTQHPNLVTASAPNLGFRHNPAPFSQQRPMPQQNHVFV